MRGPNQPLLKQGDGNRNGTHNTAHTSQSFCKRDVNKGEERNDDGPKLARLEVFHQEAYSKSRNIHANRRQKCSASAEYAHLHAIW